MTSTRNIHIADYNYDLPDERIAKFPLAQRDSSKLLIYNKGMVSEDVFTSLPHHLPKNALMVFNNTKVIQARLHFQKETGATIEVFCMEPFAPVEYQQNFAQTGSVEWLCMIGNLKRWKEGKLTRRVSVKGDEITFCAERLPYETPNATGTNHRVRFSWDGAFTFSEILEAVGELPIPPYLNRETQESDKRTYQTVYSKIKGSVAAPTAGLHFTDNVLKALDASGIDREELTLHVGAGTFKPVKSEEIEGHEMHVEQWEPYQEISGERLEVRVVLQALLDWMDRNELKVLHTTTQIIIAPGYEYHIVKWMVTNFHQPQSTLLLLVSAFVKGDWRKIYDYALAHDFRFLSYGDSSLLKMG